MKKLLLITLVLLIVIEIIYAQAPVSIYDFSGRSDKAASDAATTEFNIVNGPWNTINQATINDWNAEITKLTPEVQKQFLNHLMNSKDVSWSTFNNIFSKLSDENIKKMLDLTPAEIKNFRDKYILNPTVKSNTLGSIYGGDGIGKLSDENRNKLLETISKQTDYKNRQKYMSSIFNGIIGPDGKPDKVAQTGFLTDLYNLDKFASSIPADFRLIEDLWRSTKNEKGEIDHATRKQILELSNEIKMEKGNNPFILAALNEKNSDENGKPLPLNVKLFSSDLKDGKVTYDEKTGIVSIDGIKLIKPSLASKLVYEKAAPGTEQKVVWTVGKKDLALGSGSINDQGFFVQDDGKATNLNLYSDKEGNPQTNPDKLEGRVDVSKDGNTIKFDKEGKGCASIGTDANIRVIKSDGNKEGILTKGDAKLSAGDNGKVNEVYQGSNVEILSPKAGLATIKVKGSNTFVAFGGVGGAAGGDKGILATSKNWIQAYTKDGKTQYLGVVDNIDLTSKVNIEEIWMHGKNINFINDKGIYAKFNSDGSFGIMRIRNKGTLSTTSGASSNQEAPLPLNPNPGTTSSSPGTTTQSTPGELQLLTKGGAVKTNLKNEVAGTGSYSQSVNQAVNNICGSEGCGSSGSSCSDGSCGSSCSGGSCGSYEGGRTGPVRRVLGGLLFRRRR